MTDQAKGVVYTKRWVVDWMLDMLGYIPDADIGRKTLIEPACGCGAFLLPIVERLCIWKTQHGDVSWEDLAAAVRAFDIDASALEHTRSLVEKLLRDKGCPASSVRTLLDAWLREEDFLLSEDVLRADFVVGNPPYIRAVEIPMEKRRQYASVLSCVTKGTDIFVGFYEKSLDLLKPDGALCFICADRWLQNAYGRRLRGKVNADFNLTTLVRMYEVRAFEEDVDAYPAITLIRNEARADTFAFINCDPTFEVRDVAEVEVRLASRDAQGRGDRFEVVQLPKPHGAELYPLADASTVRFVTDAMRRYKPIEACGVTIGIGIATGCDEVFLTDDATSVEVSRLLPLYHVRYGEKPCFLVNPWEKDGSLADLRCYPKLERYLMDHEARLKQRYVAKKDPKSWYRTIDKVQTNLVGRPKVMLPDLGSKPTPIISDKYPHHGCYWLASDEWDLEVLSGILMSRAARRFIDALGVKMRGGTLRFQAQYLRYLHLPDYAQIPEKIKEGLRNAFRSSDMRRADEFSEKVFVL